MRLLDSLSLIVCVLLAGLFVRNCGLSVLAAEWKSAAGAFPVVVITVWTLTERVLNWAFEGLN